jgi:hypothetical protein
MIDEAAWHLSHTCCQGLKGGWSASPTSGQVFLDQIDGSGTNVILGYGNCNQADNIKPSIYPVPGPNGDCIRRGDAQDPFGR